MSPMQSASSKKSAEKHKKKRERDNIPMNGVAEAIVTPTEGAPRKKRRKEAAVKMVGKGEGEAWKWTALAESSISSLPPLFTSDSRYFFTSAGSSLQIFSTATGRLISTIPAHSNTITALLLNPHDSTQLFSASLDGTLKRWDTHHGALLETLRIDQPVTHIATHPSLVDELFVVTTALGNNSDSSHVFRVSIKSKHQLPSSTSSLSNPPKAYKSSRTTHVGKTRRATGLAISACGEFLIVVGGNKAYVSRTRGNATRGFTTFMSPDPLTCLVVHPTESYFATGDERGVVRLWYCLNDTAVPATSNSSSSKSTAATTTLHWHAHAVSALSFAPSGAQLVSGGEEAVLVVWQLHSGQREYIPRVGAPIGAVSVCFGPNGGLEYAIALMDGGVVFVGSDTLRITRAVRRVRLDPNPIRPFPLVSHSQSNRIILPATHPASLQILSRTGAGTSLVGELEVAPSSRISRKDETPIEPVRVGLVALSNKGKETDAQWLATIDSRGDAEIYLKFWKWNHGDTTTRPSGLCALNTRIDRPHGEHRVTSLAFHPRGGEMLATTGEDGIVKMWGIRRSSDEEFWICAASFSYRNHIPSKALFSPDGSLLAVIHGQCITLWDTENTTAPRGTLSCVETKDPRELVFVGSSGRYVAVLGAQTVVVWDLVRLGVLWHAPLTLFPGSSQHTAHITTHPTQPTFALFQYPDAKSTRISVFGVSEPTEIRVRTVPFKLDQPSWCEFGVLGVGTKDPDRWSLVLAGDEIQESSEEGAKTRGISVDTAPFVPRTLFEDIFGRGALGPALVANSVPEPQTVAQKTPVVEEKDKEKAAKSEAFKAAKRARRKARKAKKADDKARAEAPKQNAEDGQETQESDPETPESSEPATETDLVEAADNVVSMDRLRQLTSHFSSSPKGLPALSKKNADDVVVTMAVRSALTKAKKGGFKDTRSDELLTGMFKAAIAKMQIDPALIQDICVGTVLPPGAPYEARSAALAAGIPETTPVQVINRFCSSGLMAITTVANQIRVGQIEIGLAVGVESMTANPDSGSPKLSDDIMTHNTAKDCVQPMGWTSENVAQDFNITREDMDELAALSHKRASEAQRTGKFTEIVPVEGFSKSESGERTRIIVDKDDGIRHDSTAAALGKIRSAFPQWGGGKTTGGNASQITDGAAAVLLMRRKKAEELGLPILAKYVTTSVAGLAPRIMGIGPTYAIPMVLEQTGLSIGDVDLFEVSTLLHLVPFDTDSLCQINEAFASMYVYCVRKLGLDIEKVNVNGGAIALGHPLDKCSPSCNRPSRTRTPRWKGPGNVHVHWSRNGRSSRLHSRVESCSVSVRYRFTLYTSYNLLGFEWKRIKTTLLYNY
ncbi:3-ketoacyl-CoA thiolase [Rhizoctonia solani AG-3 Rhs1AP]|uniref:3-ketoacyl-CoA thiolase n=1 Tax=Rhizoctonia solani AG-3 Rhs1AP TaxID=1086054 RepID=X8JJ28_9AGAM|nr:3-ketoacyl-CoA thiolase [Rhizoctonia solani AG-3 Rhs1AP]